MTIKKKIFFTNTIMVLFSLLLLLMLGGGMIEIFKGELLNILSKNQKVADNNYEIQQLFNNSEIEIGQWNQLAVEVGKYDYQLLVLDDSKKELYTNVTHAEKEAIESLSNNVWKDNQTSELYLIENVTIVKLGGVDNNLKYSLFATYSPVDYNFFGMNQGIIEMFIIAFLVVGAIAIAGILLGSQILTKRLIKSILAPVNELHKGAKRVDAGDLETLISYQEKDEFYEVCQTFDSMQIHLKEGIEKNAAYEKSRKDMISGISHDLRTPLTAMKGSVKGILDGIANTPEKQKQYLTIAYQRTCDMDLLLQKLFYFSKLETGSMPFFKSNTNLVTWIKNYVVEKNAEMSSKNIELSLESNKECLNSIIDVEQMHRVINNIIENSIKYANNSNLKIKIRLKETDTRNLIEIQDNGNGVDQEKLAYIFNQFYRGDESRTNQMDGNGLGLYICKYIIEQHGGKIEAKNLNGLLITISLLKGEQDV